MARMSRFDCASSSLRLRVLLRRARRGLWICLAAGVAVHGSLTGIAGTERRQEVARPLTTQFIKRQPRLTKPLELKKRPQPKRRQPRREMVAVTARTQRDQGASRFEPTQALGGLARPSVEVGRVPAFGSGGIEPTAIAQHIEGTKEAQAKIDMSLELLDIGLLNTGQYHAMVVQDPEDKRNLRGFCRLAVVYSQAIYEQPREGRLDSFQTYVMPAFLNLATAMNEYTPIATDVMGRISLNSAELMKTPWVYLMSFYAFTLPDAELQNLGQYLVSGGFVFADAHPELINRGGYVSASTSLLDALETQGIEAVYEALPNHHSVYHCYFDFSSGPPAAGDGADIHSGVPMDLMGYLDGLAIDGRLVVILSRKGYFSPWANWGATPFGYKGPYASMDPTRQLQFGVNTIIFALTQEGSITRRLMDSIR